MSKTPAQTILKTIHLREMWERIQSPHHKVITSSSQLLIAQNLTTQTSIVQPFTQTSKAARENYNNPRNAVIVPNTTRRIPIDAAPREELHNSRVTPVNPDSTSLSPSRPPPSKPYQSTATLLRSTQLLDTPNQMQHSYNTVSPLTLSNSTPNIALLEIHRPHHPQPLIN
ncbi:hypothetical protein KC19_10G174100 [Ceratodon purpureus]|uniref:Uncharacterized protein n=1 Tax=Ceratodon purpureus TaxID=3225 RepID=A0A8T0GN26_CERPU|nr:hypothetical protein KC19_10G174100 [Ceratodon purpureus]